jgi:putative spermidine/putrescine transport system permease protein
MLKRANVFLISTIVPFFLMVFLFLVVPLFTMVRDSLQTGDEGFSFGNYVEIFQNPYNVQAFKNSILISLFSALAGLVVALFTAYSVTRLSEKMQNRILILANLTSNFAGLPLAFAFIVLLGKSGLFILLFQKWGWETAASFNLYSWPGLVMIYVYFQLPLAVMVLHPLCKGIREEWKEAASLLGASVFQFWLRIGIPVLLPGIAGTFSILFANAMGAYATAYALTGSNYNLVPIRIGSLVTGDIFARPQLASAFAVLLGMVLMLAMLVNEWLARRVRRDLS